MIVPCINSEDNCLGGTEEFTCAEGLVGALCESCDLKGEKWGESYGNYKDFKCRKCKD